MEDSKARNTKKHKTQQGVQHLQCVLKQDRSTVENPIGQKAAADNDEAVNQQNAPIR